MENETQENGTFVIVHRDTEWTEHTYNIYSSVSQKGYAALQLSKGRVSCDGYPQSPGAKFKVYQGSTKAKEDNQKFDRLVMFECLDGDSPGHMICLDKSGSISSRKKDVEGYVSISDADKHKDIVFKQVVDDNESVSFLLRSFSDSSCYLGCDRSGKMLKPSKVDPTKEEARFKKFPYNTKS